jgi:hypothetical protein
MEQVKETARSETLSKLGEIVLFLEEIYSFSTFGNWVAEDNLKFELNSPEYSAFLLAELNDYLNSHYNLASEVGLGPEFLEKLGPSLTINDPSYINHLHQLALNYKELHKKIESSHTSRAQKPGCISPLSEAVSNESNSPPPNRLTAQQYQNTADRVIAKTKSFSSAFGGWEEFQIGNIQLRSKLTSESLVKDFMNFIPVFSYIKSYREAFTVKIESDNQYRILCDLDRFYQIGLRSTTSQVELTQRVGHFKERTRQNGPTPSSHPQELSRHQVSKSNS